MARRRDHELLKGLGARLRKIRSEAGWTQEGLAAAVGVEPASLSRFERGISGFSVTTLAAIAATLKVSIADLLATDREPPRPEPSEQATELVGIFNALNDEHKGLLLRVAREVAALKGARA